MPRGCPAPRSWPGLLGVGTLFATLASANGCINDASRAWFAMGRDQYLPSGSAPCIRATARPYRSIVFLVPIALAFALKAPLDQVITFSILSGLLEYTFMPLNMILFRRKWPMGAIKRGYEHPFHPIPAFVLLLPLRGDLLRGLPRLRHAACGDDRLLYHRLAVVPLLALSLRQPGGAIHHALAPPPGLLSGRSPPSGAGPQRDRGSMARWLLLPLAACLAVWFAVTALRLWEAARRSRADRANYLAAIEPLLSDPRLQVVPSGYPRLAGRFDGHAVDVQVLPDALTFRKLPALWLLVTLTEPQPLSGETRIMVRPSGLEPFSTFTDLPLETAPPPGFPEHTSLRTTAAGHLPSPVVLGAVGRLLEEKAIKEVVLSPNGLRLVRLVEEFPRSAYLLFREADLGRTPIAASVVKPMLLTLRALATELALAVPGG